VPEHDLNLLAQLVDDIGTDEEDELPPILWTEKWGKEGAS